MNKPFRHQLVTVGILLLFAAVIPGLVKFTFAATKKEARVTQVVRDVRLLAAQAAPRPASVNDSVHEGTAVRTGSDSRAELTFSDQTLTRLGADTVFSFGAATGQYDLGSGAILMCVPRSSGAVKIKTAVATAAVTGFTGMFEYHAKSWSKFIILHGNGVFTRNKHPGDPVYPGDPVHPITFHAGQMLIFLPSDPFRPPVVYDVDLSKLLQGKLVKGFKRPLPELDLILAEIEKQQTSPPSGGLIDPTSNDTIDQSINARPHPPEPAPRPTFTIPDGGRRSRP